MKTSNIILRISPEQKQTWVEYAKLMGISVGELIRTAVEKEIQRITKLIEDLKLDLEPLEKEIKQ